MNFRLFHAAYSLNAIFSAKQIDIDPTIEDARALREAMSYAPPIFKSLGKAAINIAFRNSQETLKLAAGLTKLDPKICDLLDTRSVSPDEMSTEQWESLIKLGLVTDDSKPNA